MTDKENIVGLEIHIKCLLDETRDYEGDYTEALCEIEDEFSEILKKHNYPMIKGSGSFIHESELKNVSATD